MDGNSNALNWFEIAAKDIQRAKEFYETIFQIKMDEMQMGEDKMAFFPWSAGSGKATGAVVQGENNIPCTHGSMIYLNANPDLSDVLARINDAGGEVLTPKTSIGEHGNIAFFKDTEGNKVALHSNQ